MANTRGTTTGVGGETTKPRDQEPKQDHRQHTTGEAGDTMGLGGGGGGAVGLLPGIMYVCMYVCIYSTSLSTIGMFACWTPPGVFDQRACVWKSMRTLMDRPTRKAS